MRPSTRAALILSLLAALAGTSGAQQTSPFAPPTATDRTFVVDSGPFLDTGCTFRSGGPLVIDVPVTRFVGPINSDGTLQNAAQLVTQGLLSSMATVFMPVFDVDDTASVTPPAQPEIDRVLFNGMQVGFLSGQNNVWKLNSFQVPIGIVKFPDRAAVGSSPTPAMNTITIEIDIGNIPTGQELWCTAVDWVALSFKAISPVILIHGNNSDGGFYTRQGFAGALTTLNVPFDNSINMPTSTRVVNGMRLSNLIPPIVQSFGVDSVHFVCHSKGGLDTREYLQNYFQPGMPFDVLSMTTLSSPHNGSSGADVLVAYQLAAARADSVQFSGFPNFTQTLSSVLGVDAGTPDLTTWNTGAFNGRNISALPGAIVYNACAGDADQNGTATIDILAEYAELLTENAQLNNLEGAGLADNVIDRIYQILRNTRTVRITYATVPGTFFGTNVVATVTNLPNPTPLGNDTLVTIPSGLGTGGWSTLTAATATFTGGMGRNHSSIADAGVAVTVFPWIRQTEQTIGDLK